MNANFKDLIIVPLAEDIRQILDDLGQDNLEIMSLCMDHSNPHLLEDEKPVFCDISQDQLLCIFDFGINHFFLHPDQLYRFILFCKLGLKQSIALIIKSEWELFLSKSIGQIASSTERKDSYLLNRKLIEKHLIDFKPDKDGIYKLVQELPHNKSSAVIRGNTNLIVEDMVKNLSFLGGNNQISNFYPETECNESQLLRNSAQIAVKKYTTLKYLWKRLSTELEEKLLEGEKKKRINQNLEDLYFRTFGNLVLEKKVLSNKVERYKTSLELKKRNPNLTYKHALRQAIEHLSENEKKTRELRNAYMRSLNCIGSSLAGCTTGISHSEIKQYKEEVKVLLKKLFFLLHEDTCPLQKLSEKQKKGISKLWVELMSSKDELFSFTPSMLMWSLPDYERLLSILERACILLDINIEDLDVGDRLDLMIKKGTPIEEIVEFLERDVDNLQLHLTHLDIIQDEYINEDKTRRYSEALEDVGNHKSKLQKELIALKNQIIEIKDNIRLVFKKELNKTIVIDHQ